MNNIAVIGAGQMGSGIAQVLTHAGYNVLMYDNNDQSLDKGYNGIAYRLNNLKSKGKITATELDATVGRLYKCTELSEICRVDLVIEAVVESIDTKVQLFKELDKICSHDTIFATNTSSLAITEIAAITTRPEKVIGMHFMNPVPVMKLVEVIRGLSTDEEVFKEIKRLAEDIGKTPVEVPDTPGFVGNRILIPMINEAICVLNEGQCEVEDIDTVMKLGMNHPIGPLALADLIGLDTVLFIMEVLHKDLGEKYRPSILLKKYVKAGWLGKKAERGFYQYT